MWIFRGLRIPKHIYYGYAGEFYPGGCIVLRLEKYFAYQETVNGYTWEIMKQYVFVAFLCNSVFSMGMDHVGDFSPVRLSAFFRRVY